MNSSENAIEEILKAQNNAFNKLPKLVQRAALPLLAPKTTPSMWVKNDSIEQSRPATSVESRPPTSSIGFPSLPKLGTVHQKPLESIIEKPPLTIEKPQTPLYPIPRTNISYMLNLNDIDENEVLRPDSVASTVIESERETTKKILRIPDTFSEFRELSVDLDQVSLEDIDEMLQNTKSHDHHNNGFVSMTALLSSIRIIHPSDTWQHLLDWLIATSIEEEKDFFSSSSSPSNLIFLIDYQLFFDVLQNDKQAREVLVNIPEVLESDDNGSVFSHLPSRPTSSQEQREKWRVRLLIDLEVILSTNTDIDIERFKTATDKKIISVEELRMLFQIYGITEHIHHIEQRIIDCFLTHDQYFCFSAFVGCLNQINPDSVQSRSPSPPETPWSKSSIRKLDDSGVIADLDTTGSSFTS
uniref:CCR4-NOT transcription complex subunit 11 n=2 Tax=Caenorhabditis tropicalis TaxID=1561998 RepID=A0A1I7UYW9_9PELO